MIFIVSFFLLLDLYRSYRARTLGPLSVLALGLVWLSLADFGNALWAYQLAWYLVLFFLISMMWSLLVLRRTSITFALACLAAVAGWYSSLQGLLLWPIGLLCLWWTLRERRHDWRDRASVEIIVWLLLGAVTTGIYFLGYVSSRTPGYPTAALSRPLELGKFILVTGGTWFRSGAHTISSALR